MREKGTILCVYISNNRDAMGDLYIDTLNALPNHESIVVVLPCAYDETELDENFLCVKKELEPIPSGWGGRLRYYRKLTHQCFEWSRQYDIRKVYWEIGKVPLEISMLVALRGIEYTLWLHDPFLHDGETWKATLSRWLEIHFVFPRVKRFVVSYSGCLKPMHGTPLRNILPRTHVLRLPQMRQMEFAEVRGAEWPLQWDFIFWGRIELYKGLDVLLEVMHEPDMRYVRVLIVGRGREADMVEAQAAELPNVTYIRDYVPNRELAEYIMQSRFVVLPYRSATGSQTVAIANYYRRLVLATAVGCFPEYIAEGRNGFLMPRLEKGALKQAMLDMMQLQEADYTASIAEEYEKFDITRIAAQLDTIIRGADTH